MIVFHIILQKISANIELEVHNRGKISLREKNAVTIIRDPQFPNFYL